MKTVVGICCIVAAWASFAQHSDLDLFHQEQSLETPRSLKIPYTTLNNGVKMPMVGLGTWEYNESTTYDAVKLALSLGYVHIDTAVMYENQKGVGRAVRDSQVPRKEIFITTKIPGGSNYSAATEALESSLHDLGMDFVDLMLVHFPATWEGEGGPDMRVETWKAMEDFHKQGKARAIGISHYCRHHVEDLLNMLEDRDGDVIMPQLNQVEFHVGMGQAGPNATDDREWMELKGIKFASFSPLCGPCQTNELITGDMVTSIGKKYGKSGAQVSLRWQTQQGIPVIPKTTSAKHMLANADIFDWSLSEEDMKALTEATSPPVTGGGDNKTSGDCKIQRLL